MSACNKDYLGTVEEDYIPTKEIIYLDKNKILKSDKGIELMEAKLFENFDIFQDPRMNLKINEFGKINKIFKNDSISNFVKFNNNIIYISKKYSLNSYNDTNLISKSFLPKQFKKNNNHFFKIILEKNQLFVISTYGDIFKINNDWSFEFLTTANKKINFITSQKGKFLFLDLNGELVIYDEMTNLFSTSDGIEINYGYKNKTYDINIYGDTLLHNINTSTIAVIDLKNFNFLNNFVLDSLNILSSIGEISKLVNTPILIEGGFLFASEDGKMFNFQINNDEILWELDINEIIIDYILYSNAIILLTKDNIYALEASTGKLIKKYNHELVSPSFLSLVNSNLLVIDEDHINTYDLNSDFLNTLKTIKFKNNNINAVGYSYGNYYLKNEDGVYILGE